MEKESCEIVHCKDCGNWHEWKDREKRNGKAVGTCSGAYIIRVTPEDGFCYLGKLRKKGAIFEQP